MTGRLPSERTTPPGPHPDWADIEWHVYDDPVTVRGVVTHCYRVSPRKLSKGEMRRFEKHVATVRRCSMYAVKRLLKLGVAPKSMQLVVDANANTQAKRSTVQPNVYRDLIERLRPKGATQEAA